MTVHTSDLPEVPLVALGVLAGEGRLGNEVTGTLRLSSEGREGFLYFKDGTFQAAAVSTSPVRVWERVSGDENLPLPENEREALHAIWSRGEGKKLILYIQDEDILPNDYRSKLAKEHTLDALDHIAEWQSATIDFIPTDENIIFVIPATKSLVEPLEVVKKRLSHKEKLAAAWGLNSILSLPDVTLRLQVSDNEDEAAAAAAVTDAFTGIPATFRGDAARYLKELRQLGGSAKLSDLALASGASEFQVYQVLERLLQKTNKITLDTSTVNSEQVEAAISTFTEPPSLSTSSSSPSAVLNLAKELVAAMAQLSTDETRLTQELTEAEAAIEAAVAHRDAKKIELEAAREAHSEATGVLRELI